MTELKPATEEKSAPQSGSVTRGVTFAIGGRLVSLFFRGVASILLGRMLLPADFGIVNFSGIVTGFVSRFNDVGIESAVMQRGRLESRVLSTAFSLKLAMSATMMFVLWVLAAPLAEILGSPQAVPVIRVMAGTFVLTAFTFVPLVTLRKSLRYDTVARIWVLGTLAGSVSSVIMALLGWGYWSIAIGQVIDGLVSFLVAQWLQPSSYAWGFDWQECRHLLAFGGRVFLSNILVFALFNSDNFLIGLKLGAAQLGQYGIAFNWATQICGFVGGTVLNVLFPAFANLGGDREKVCALYLSSLRPLAFLGALGYGVFVFISPEFLVMVLGRGTNKWLGAIPVLGILCVYGIIRQLLEPLGNVLLALGRADLLWRSNALVLAIELAGIIAALWLGGGIIAVAWVVLVAYSIQYCYFLRYIPQDLGISAWAVLKVMIPALVTVSALAVASTLWRAPSWGWLLCKTGLGTICALLLYVAAGGLSDIRASWAQLRERFSFLMSRETRVSFSGPTSSL